VSACSAANLIGDGEGSCESLGFAACDRPALEQVPADLDRGGVEQEVVEDQQRYPGQAGKDAYVAPVGAASGQVVGQARGAQVDGGVALS
jgi:hypothetical protein